MRIAMIADIHSNSVSLDGKIVAAALGRANHDESISTYHLSEMFVHKNHQRSGLGSRLLSHLEHELHQKGLKQIGLHTAEGTPAYEFYKKHGFQNVRSLKENPKIHDLQKILD